MRLLLFHILTAISISFFGMTRALPLPTYDLSIERGLTARELHNADFNNAGGPPQTTNSGSLSQDSHPSSGTRAKPGSPEQEDAKAARSDQTRSNAHWERSQQITDRRHPVNAHAPNHSPTISSRKVTHHKDSDQSDDGKQVAPPPSSTPSNAPRTRLLMGTKSPSPLGPYENTVANNDNAIYDDEPLSKRIKMNKDAAGDGTPYYPLGGALTCPLEAGF